MKIRILPLLVLAMLAACGAPSRPARPDDTQVVAQWRFADNNGWFWSVRAFVWQNRIDNACGMLCNFDGNDIGQGKLNLFLYTEDVLGTVKMLATLESEGKLPPGMQIGVAHYKDKARKDWDYVSVYPKGSRRFDL